MQSETQHVVNPPFVISRQDYYYNSSFKIFCSFYHVEGLKPNSGLEKYDHLRSILPFLKLKSKFSAAA